MLSAILYAVTSAGVRLDNALRKDDGGWWPTIIKLGTGLVGGTAVRNGSVVETPIQVDTSVIATKDYADSVGAGVEAHTVTATAPVRIDGGNSADLSADRTISITAASGAAAGSMSAAHFALVDGATASATASTLIKRDADGRAQVADPSADADIANKGFVVSASAAAVAAAPGAAVDGAASTSDDSEYVDLEGCSFELPVGKLAIVYVDVIAQSAASNFAESRRIVAGNNAGSYTELENDVIGTSLNGIGVVGLSGTMTGTTVQLTAKGAAGTDVTWTGWLRAYVQP